MPADDKRDRSLLPYYIALLALWLFHALNNLYYLRTTDPPPNFDCGYHLQLSLHVYDRFLDFDSDHYWKGVLTSSGFYPFAAYLAAIPLYALFGFNQDAAIAGNLIFLAILIWGAFEIGRALKNPQAGLLSAVLVAFFPFVFGISRNYYIETALMAATTLSVYALICTRRFERRGVSLLFGLSVGFGMMVKWTFAVHLLFPCLWVFGLILSDTLKNRSYQRTPTHVIGWLLIAIGAGTFATALAINHFLLWGFFSLLPILVGVAWLIPFPRVRNRLLNIGLAGLAAVLLCYPWYIRYWDHVTGVATNFFDADYTGQASSWTLASFLYYPFALESNQMGSALFLGFVITIALFPWRQSRKYGIILGWILGSYLLTSIIPFKDPRFISPYLPGIALFMGIAVASISLDWLRRGVITLLSIGAIWQFGMMTFEWPLPADNHWRLGPHAYMYSFWNHGVYGTARDRTEKWPHREIVQDFESRIAAQSPSDSTPELRCLIDYHGLHQGVFEYIAEAERARWDSVFDRTTYRLDYELNRWPESEALLFPTAPLNGDLYQMRDERRPFEFNQDPNSFIRSRFPDQLHYGIPTGATIVLAFKDKGRTIGPGQTFRFDRRMELRKGKVLIEREGERFKLRAETEWEYLHNDNWPKDSMNRIWLDLYSPTGDRLASHSFPLEPGFETGQIDWRNLEWILPPEVEGLPFQTALRIGSADGQESVEIRTQKGQTIPTLFFTKVLYAGE
ncbi:MAG: glycosyltransferase family 39 protein [Candidatus Omnitrophica bacterium]|nr:glycosyltransferase family 39 protein [Candidatus Omnitrophota bacterium]